MPHTRWEQARGEALARQEAREARTAAQAAPVDMSAPEAIGGFLVALGRFLTLLVWGPILLFLLVGGLYVAGVIFLAAVRVLGSR